MNVRFQFDYGYKPEGEELEALRKVVPNLRLAEDGKVESWTTYTADLNDIYSAAPKVGIRIAGLEGTNIPKLLAETINKLEAMANTLAAAKYSNENTYNKKVEVHVPGMGLLMIDEVQVFDDYCTEQLQDRIDEGWRIIAACPQPDQRRPDYVMGRTRK